MPNIGDRIPALFTNRNTSILYATNIDDNGNKFEYSPSFETGKWYSFEIEQQFSEDQVKIGIVYKYSLLTFFL